MERIGPAPGSQIGGYTVVAPLGSGGMGTVYRAVDDGGDAVALKLLHPHVASDGALRARLVREVAALQRLRHPAVASVLDAETDSTEAFIVTELVAGDTLADRVRKRGPLDESELLTLAEGLRSALAAVHAAGVVHRDLKPANVMLTDDGPVLIDFGLAQGVDDDANLTTAGFVLGTPGYLAPELLDGGEPGVATDMWGWAALLAFAATGRDPFGSRPVEAVLARARSGDVDLDGVGPAVRAAILGALRPAPEDRTAPQDVVAALREVAERGEPEAGAVPTVALAAGAGAAGGAAAGAVALAAAGEDDDEGADDDGPTDPDVAQDEGGEVDGEDEGVADDEGDDEDVADDGADALDGEDADEDDPGRDDEADALDEEVEAGAEGEDDQVADEEAAPDGGTDDDATDGETGDGPGSDDATVAIDLDQGADEDADEDDEDAWEEDDVATELVAQRRPSHQDVQPTVAVATAGATAVAAAPSQAPVHDGRTVAVPVRTPDVAPVQDVDEGATDVDDEGDVDDEDVDGVDWIEEDLERSAEDDEEVDEDWDGYVRPSARPRWGSLAGLALVVVLAGALYPVVTLAVVLGLVVLARTVGGTVEAMHARRERRGVRGSDRMLAVLSSPWYLVRGALGVLPATLVAAAVLVIAGGVAWWLLGSGRWSVDGSPSGQEPQGLTAALVVAAFVAVGVVLVWWGPLSRMTRTGARRTLALVAPGPLGGLVVVVLCLVAAILLADRLLDVQPITWWPVPTPTLP